LFQQPAGFLGRSAIFRLERPKYFVGCFAASLLADAFFQGVRDETGQAQPQAIRQAFGLAELGLADRDADLLGPGHTAKFSMGRITILPGATAARVEPVGLLRRAIHLRRGALAASSQKFQSPWVTDSMARSRCLPRLSGGRLLAALVGWFRHRHVETRAFLRCPPLYQ